MNGIVADQLLASSPLPCRGSASQLKKLTNPANGGAVAEGIQNDASGVHLCDGCKFAAEAPLHWARMSIAFDLDSARSVKSTGSDRFGTVKVAVTGSNVPDENAGIVTSALDELTTVKPCKPGFEFAGSTVTEPSPAVIEVNELKLPCLTSVTVNVGVQVPPPGV